MITSAPTKTLKSDLADYPSDLAMEYMAGEHGDYFKEANEEKVAVIMNSFITLAYELNEQNTKLKLALLNSLPPINTVTPHSPLVIEI